MFKHLERINKQNQMHCDENIIRTYIDDLSCAYIVIKEKRKILSITIKVLFILHQFRSDFT